MKNTFYNFFFGYLSACDAVRHCVFLMKFLSRFMRKIIPFSGKGKDWGRKGKQKNKIEESAQWKNK